MCLIALSISFDYSEPLANVPSLYVITGRVSIVCFGDGVSSSKGH